MLRDYLSRFVRDEGGAFAIIFGVVVVILVALAGAAVDYTRMEERRNRAQIALDAATLALQPRIHDTAPEEIRLLAERLLIERLQSADHNVGITGIAIDTEAGSLRLTGKIEVPMAFVNLVGIHSLSAGLTSEAIQRKLLLEVAMVLDNSSSMTTGNRIGNLRQAAGCAARTLFYDEVDRNCQPVSGAKQIEDVRIGIVPFSMYVNIGTDHRHADWLDWEGYASVSQDNFETGMQPNYVSRDTLFSRLRTNSGDNIEWAGCVVAREYPFDTLDTIPTPGSPPEDARTLFTPLFAPDEPRGYSNDYLSDTGGNCPIMTCTRYYNNCSVDRRGAISCTGSPAYTHQTGSFVTRSTYSCMTDGPLLSQTTGSEGGRTTLTQVYSLLSERELQEQTCKYNNAVANISSTRGPNANCTSQPVLPLTTEVETVTSRINSMVASGYTNIQQGAAWGWHVLSPDLPFTEATAYDANTSKVMIVMTDGENYNSYSNYSSNMNGTSLYNAYGHRYNERLSGNNNSQMIAAMNQRTLETCNNAKAEGIIIYSIGLEVSSNVATRDMLRGCATTPQHAYFPDRPADLNSVFAAIADQLAALRLSQ